LQFLEISFYENERIRRRRNQIYLAADTPGDTSEPDNDNYSTLDNASELSIDLTL